MANMRCTVKFFLDQVTCPGSLHLPDRNPVYLTIFLFGRLQKSPNVYPSFPMCFTTKIKFPRLFTNAKTPEQLLEILEDETILIELRQHVKGLKGGRVLAAFEETTRTFLFPSPSNIPKKNHIKRAVLLTRTDNFPLPKGLDPQFTFHTKTYIEEGPFDYLTPENIPVNRQMPASEVSPTIFKDIPQSSPSRNVSLNKPDVNTHTVIEGLDSQAGKHCICDCPTLYCEPAALDNWLANINKKKLKRKEKKPFLTGKAPKQLLSQRQFSDSCEEKKKFSRTGICNYCAVPLHSCVLCNAYKLVYGTSSFLIHRFKKNNRSKKKRVIRRNRSNTNAAASGQDTRCTPKYDATKYSKFDEIAKRTVDVNVLTADGNLKPIKRSSNKNYSVSKYSGDDSDLDGIIRASSSPLPPRSCPRSPIASTLLKEERPRSVPPKSIALHSNLFNPPIIRSLSKEELESARIHQRIKNLMKKNNSVLQYDLSSSESLTDEDCDIEDVSLSDSSLEDSPTYMTPKKNVPVPAQSVVEPLTSKKQWSSGNINGLSHRERLDAQLKAIYADLYQKTLNNP